MEGKTSVRRPCTKVHQILIVLSQRFPVLLDLSACPLKGVYYMTIVYSYVLQRKHGELLIMDSRNLLCGHFGCCAVVLCIAMWYGACTQVSFASFTATEEARVYDAVVDVASGLPLEDAVIRLLPPAEIQIFTEEEVETLSEALNVFNVEPDSADAITDASSHALEAIPIRIHEGPTAKPVRTNADGIVEWKVEYLNKFVSFPDGIGHELFVGSDQSWILIASPGPPTLPCLMLMIRHAFISTAA